MKLLLLVLAGILIIATPAFARLGETPDQCLMRYGAIKAQRGLFSVYYFNRLNVAVQFSDAVSVKEVFAPDPGEKLKDDQISELLAANSKGSTWSVQAGSYSLRLYSRDDGGASATLDRSGELTIYSKFSKIAPGKQPTSGF